MRVPEDDGYEEVMIERRWPDMVAARAWCERIVRRAQPGTTILEIQVFEESWRHAKSWETTKTRPAGRGAPARRGQHLRIRPLVRAAGDVPAHRIAPPDLSRPDAQVGWCPIWGTMGA